MRIIQRSLWTLCLLSPVIAFATEQPAQFVPDAERRPGETLTERLDRTDSVIKPPAVNDDMLVAPPANDAKTPIIKPGAAPPQQVFPVK